MHELPVTEKILAIALKHGAQNRVDRILSITLRIGGLADLEERWLQHYFNYLSKGSVAENAQLIITHGGIQLCCGGCNTLIDTSRKLLQDVMCPHCGASEGFSVISGKEYVIEEMEVQ